LCNQRHGCVIVKSGRVVAAQVNTFRNNPDNMSEDHIKSGCTVHAERNAIRRAGANAEGSTMYIARVNKQGVTRLSRPCNNCYVALMKAGVKEIVYTS